MARHRERGIELALKLAGLWKTRTRDQLVYTAEVELLSQGKVDAVYTSHGRGQSLERTGKFKAIEDFSRYPDWTLQVANSPYALTVNTEFARKNRDIVVAFLKATVRSARSMR